MSQPESRLQRRIRKALETEVGGFWWKVHGGPFTPAGIPDLAGIVEGRAFFLEVKRPDGDVSLVQRRRMRQLSDAGAHCAVVRTPEEALEFVRDILVMT